MDGVYPPSLEAAEMLNAEKENIMELQSEAPVRNLSHGMPIIREAKLCLLERVARYRLLEQQGSPSQFFIEITYNEEARMLPVAQSFSRAAYLFELLVAGEVTPCTLQDVLEDLADTCV